MGSVIFALMIIAIVVAMLVAGVKSIKIQHEGQIGIVEAWGRFARVLAPGRYILWPWERVVDELPLQIFEWETPALKLMLRGGTQMTISAIVHYQIEHAHKTPGAPRPPRIIGTTPAPLGTHAPTAGHALPAGAGPTPHGRNGIGIDSLEPGTRAQGQRRSGPPAPAHSASGATTILNRVMGRGGEQLAISQAAYRAKYLVHDWQEATKKETLAVLQQVFSKIGIAEDINGDINWIETLGTRVREHLQEKTEEWGVQILEVDFKDPSFPEMTMANLHAETRTEREGRVRTKEAESYKRVADILGLSPGELLRWRQVEIMRELSKAQQPRVMFTTDLMGRMNEVTPAQPGVYQAMTATDRELGPGTPAAPGAVGAPDLRGYLGQEPPAPALSQAQLAERGGALPVTGGGPGMVAPSLQNVDQQ